MAMHRLEEITELIPWKGVKTARGAATAGPFVGCIQRELADTALLHRESPNDWHWGESQ
jgi:hypothetical protein